MECKNITPIKYQKGTSTLPYLVLPSIVSKSRSQQNFLCENSVETMHEHEHDHKHPICMYLCSGLVERNYVVKSFFRLPLSLWKFNIQRTGTGQARL